MSRGVLAGVLFALWLAAPGPSGAQDPGYAPLFEPEAAAPEAPEAAEARDATEGAPDESGSAEAPPPEIDPASLDLSVMEADRASRIQAAIESDRRKLADLRQDAVRGDRQYEEFTRTAKQLGQAIEAKEKLLGELGEGGDPQQVANLQREIAASGREKDLAKQKANLVFQAIKTFREQIRGLERKIILDEGDLDRITGIAEEFVPVPSAGPGPEPAPAAPSGSPSPFPYPGAGVLTGSAKSANAVAKPRLPETADQIEARMEAEKRERAAFLAEQAVASFVDRKAALEEQIALEQELLKTAREAETILEAGLEVLELNMAELIEVGAPKQELRRLQREIASNDEALDRVRRSDQKRVEEIDHLQERLLAAQQDQLAVIEQAGRKRQEAEDARQRSIWLDSPFHPENLKRWGLARGPRILLVALAAASLLVLVRFFATRLTRILVRGGRHRRGGGKRADTLAVSFRSAGSSVIVVGGLLMMIEQAGVSVTTVLGGAAIFGVALAFGAQNLMRDYFNGLIILVEDQYELNDLLTIGGITGRVERLNLRTTVLRDLKGRVHFIPNGEIKAVTNHTYEWSRAVLDIPVGFKEDVDVVMATLLEVAEKLRVDPEFKDVITSEPIMLGVDRFAESGPVVKFMLTTVPDDRFRVRREMLRRIKIRFDELGIEIQVPHRVVIQQTAAPEPGEDG